jgi:hypothetical protein
MKRAILDMLRVPTMSFDGWLALWWVTIPLALFFIVSVGNIIYRRIPLTRPSVALCLLVPVSAMVFAAMAVLFAADHTLPTAVEDTVLPVKVLGALGLVAIITATACVLFAKNQRIMAASVALFGGWLVYWVFFVAAMSVSGVWL